MQVPAGCKSLRQHPIGVEQTARQPTTKRKALNPSGRRAKNGGGPTGVVSSGSNRRPEDLREDAPCRAHDLTTSWRFI